ncbi:MAG: hypothetical protein GEV09_28490, partial [Pseudonocardiaceae bacterium]|nr:hypothetical protein [Pseudonocardiaceae bacterium]
TYQPGRRGLGWLKLKKALATLDCVVVGVEWGHGKRRGVLSDYTFAVRETDAPEARLLTIGKAYTGLTDAEIAELVRLARRTEQDAGCPQDGEFVTEDGPVPSNVFLVQARPETAWRGNQPRPVSAGKTAMDAILGTLSRLGSTEH